MGKKFKLEQDRSGAVILGIIDTDGSGFEARFRSPDGNFQEFEKAFKKLKKGSAITIVMP